MAANNAALREALLDAILRLALTGTPPLPPLVFAFPYCPPQAPPASQPPGASGQLVWPPRPGFAPLPPPPPALAPVDWSWSSTSAPASSWGRPSWQSSYGSRWRRRNKRKGAAWGDQGTGDDLDAGNGGGGSQGAAGSGEGGQAAAGSGEAALATRGSDGDGPLVPVGRAGGTAAPLAALDDDAGEISEEEEEEEETSPTGEEEEQPPHQV